MYKEKFNMVLYVIYVSNTPVIQGNSKNSRNIQNHIVSGKKERRRDICLRVRC